MSQGEYTNHWEIDVQAQALAEKTVAAPLEALAQLCPLAESLIDRVLHLPDQVPAEAVDMLGLLSMDEVREFFDSVIFKVRQAPQDVLAQYLYQGRAARDAGISPRAWIRVHRLSHLAALQIAHHFKHRDPLSEEIQHCFFLTDERNYMMLLSLHERSNRSFSERLSHLGTWALEVRKAAARGLLLQAQDAHPPLPSTLASGRGRSARIPLSQVMPPLQAPAPREAKAVPALA